MVAISVSSASFHHLGDYLTTTSILSDIEIRLSRSLAKLSKHLTSLTSFPMAHTQIQTASWEVYVWNGLDAQLHVCPDDGDRDGPEMSAVVNSLIWLIA
jgi:hypothetical protein